MSLKSIVDQIVSVRKLVCPRTSYSTGGDAASRLFILNISDNFLSSESLSSEILQSKEFDYIQNFHSLDEVSKVINGHVILIIGSFSDSALFELLINDKSKLIFNLQNISSDQSDIVIQSEYQQFIRTSSFEYLSLGLKLIAWAKLKTLNLDAPKLTYGFGGQPTVKSRLQFRYLWGLQPLSNNISDNIQEGKLRVLQRLSSRDTHKKEKIASDIWDQMIMNALKNNSDDWNIYSMIREIFLGKSLEFDINDLTAKVNSSEEDAEGNGEENRADFLVKMVLDCLPKDIIHNPENYIRNLLDYGCAEGAITSILGEKLNLSSNQIYGADVRSITSKGFNFLHLPKESENPPALGEILPDLTDGSISLINASMVFHHVTHIKSTLLELRRVISPTGFLIIREHDSPTPAISAFLDIVHGLYSLSWQDPIEWPDFITEYEAFYRTRDDWTTLLKDCGFILPNNPLPNLYHAAERSTFRNGKFGNVIRAYQAVYVPDPQFNLIETCKKMNLLPSKRKECILISALEDTIQEINDIQPKVKRARVENSSKLTLQPPTILFEDSNGQYLFRQSNSIPGKYYKYYPTTKKSIWL